MNIPDQHNFARRLDTSARPVVIDRTTWQADALTQKNLPSSVI